MFRYIYGWDLHECVLWSENARDKTAIYLLSFSFEEWLQMLHIRHMNTRILIVWDVSFSLCRQAVVLYLIDAPTLCVYISLKQLKVVITDE
jgi:hypothetical protein